MTPEQALQLLNQVAALAPVNRADHSAVIQAVEILQAVLNDMAAEAAKNDGLDSAIQE